ncbi:MAG: tyrosine-type recombinase/integrase, partial [Pirellula sp.]
NTDFWEKNPITFDNVFFLAEYATTLRASKLATSRLAKDGAKWALTYRMLALSGLRWNELRTLRVGRLRLDEGLMILDSNYTKNSSADRLPVPKELTEDLKAWIEENKLEPSDLLFNLPGKGANRFHRDCEVAGIPRVDDMGRKVDIHALRHSFGTLLARSCTPIAVAMKLMRHSKAELTLGIYQDAQVLDFRGASDSLPALGAMREKVAEPVKEDPKPVAPAIPSGNEALLKAFLETADAETLRKAMLKSLGQ